MFTFVYIRQSWSAMHSACISVFCSVLSLIFTPKHVLLVLIPECIECPWFEKFSGPGLVCFKGSRMRGFRPVLHYCCYCCHCYLHSVFPSLSSFVFHTSHIKRTCWCSGNDPGFCSGGTIFQSRT
jgi:hypothetical protein